MNLDPEITVVAPPTPQSPHPDTLSSVTALARFEFEPGRGNDGTKIMMVEWQDDDQTRDKLGTWQVSWQGKKTVFAADDNSDEIRRLYFLLPPGAIIPSHIVIGYQSPPKGGSTDAGEVLKLAVNPLPAIFTPELGATAKASGKKGVLHTIWAKKRLQSLNAEIQREQEHNLEGIALEMALAEKEWIESSFGLGAHAEKPREPLRLDLASLQTNTTSPPLSPALQSPKSPGGRRLTEKLKGLSISTGGKDLPGLRAVNTPTRDAHPLSPENGDMAYSSFSMFRDQPLSQAQPPKQTAATTTTTRKMVAQAPPDLIKLQQNSNAAASLNFIATNPMDAAVDPSAAGAGSANNNAEAEADDLFAVALSPRSPDDPKSPFSIPASDVGAFSKIKGYQS